MIHKLGEWLKAARILSGIRVIDDHISSSNRRLVLIRSRIIVHDVSIKAVRDEQRQQCFTGFTKKGLDQRAVLQNPLNTKQISFFWIVLRLNNCSSVDTAAIGLISY